MSVGLQLQRRSKLVEDTMKDEIRSLGKRLKDARRDAEMTGDEVAKALSKSKQLISHWEAGRSEITIVDLRKVASLYGVEIDWLLSGTPSKSGMRLKPRQGRIVSKASKAEILEIARGALTIENIAEKRHTYADCSAQSFSFEIFEDAMDGGSRHGVTAFKPSHIVTVDREKMPSPGECVLLVMVRSKDIVFRRYKSQGFGKPLAVPFKLTADNSSYDMIDVKRTTDFVFFGTLVEHVILGSK